MPALERCALLDVVNTVRNGDADPKNDLGMGGKK
jgi:hypothetical protein